MTDAALFDTDTDTDTSMVTPPTEVAEPQPLGTLLLDTTNYPGRFVVVHTLTTMSDVNPNRDFEGLPKRTNYGGFDRLRVSAQSRGRAARVWSRKFLKTTDQAARTNTLPGVVRKLLTDKHGYDPADASATAAALIASTKMGIDWARPDRTTALMLVPSSAATWLAELAHTKWDALAEARDSAREVIDARTAAAADKAKGKKGKGKKADAAEAPADTADTPPETDADDGDEQDEATFKTSLVPAAIAKFALGAFDAASSIDIALYGRMLANIPNGQVDPAVQIVSAFSVDAIAEIMDEFTVVDDWQADDVFGAAHIGRRYLASGTLYGYAALDRDTLRETLAAGHPDPDDAARLAEQVFVASVAWSTPSGMRSRTATTVPPTLVIAATTDMPLSAAPAFETPVDAPAGITGSHRLCERLIQMDRRFPLLGGCASWISPDGTPAPTLPTNITLD